MDSILGIGWGAIAAIPAFTVAAVFRMLQLAIIRSRAAEFRQFGRKHPAQWRYARLIRAHSSEYLFVCRLGFFCGVLCLGLALAATIGVVERGVLAHELGSIVAGLAAAFTVILYAALFLFLLQLCRVVAYNFPEHTLLLFGSSLTTVGGLIAPFARALDSASERTIRAWGLLYPNEKAIGVQPDELREIVEGGDGAIEESEKKMIKGVFLLSDTSVREIMTPRADIISVGVETALDQLLKLFMEEKLSRFLVTGETLDDVRGVVHAKDLLQFVGSRSKWFDLRAIIRPAVTVPGNSKVDEVLQEFRRRAVHFAVVLDEHGGVDGVVTVEDLLEEIVGDIFDEFDSPADEAEVKRTNDGDLIIDASMAVDDFNRRFSTYLPKGEYDTMAGFVLHRLSRMPEPGEIVECDRLRVRVEAIEQNRIVQLRIFKRRRPLRAVPKRGAGPILPSKEDAPGPTRAGGSQA